MKERIFASLFCTVALLALPAEGLTQINNTPAKSNTLPAGPADSLAAGTISTDASQASGDIVVTARKRRESIMNVPVVATTIGSEQLERLNTADMKALATLVPGLSFGTSVLSVGTIVSLRGVGTSALDPGVDSSVALNIDGMALSNGLAYASGLFDLGGVEVLKGPQSLFYGKSSPGGVISLRTADPTDRTEIILRGGYEFEARERRVDAILSGALTDTLRVRIAGTYGKQDGYFKNPAVAIPALGAAGPSSDRLGPITDYKVRATILFNPTSRLSLRLKLNRAYDKTLYAASIQNVVCPEGVTAINGRQFVYAGDDCRLNRSVPQVDYDPAAFPGVLNNGVPYTTTTQNFGTAEINYRIQPNLLLTSQTGYYHVSSSSLLNGTGSSAGEGLFNVENTFRRRQFTQELRLVSDNRGPLNFTLGGFFERGRVTINPLLAGNLRLGAPPILQIGQNILHIKTDSVFGQVLYKIVPRLEIAAGARWTDERRNEDSINSISGAPVPITLAVPKISARNVSPEISVTYRPTDDLTVFGSLKQGYKSGSFSIATPATNGQNTSFNDERVRGAELGIKTRSPDRRLTFDVSGFYYKYRGLQVGANTQAANGVTSTRTVNAGAARSYGIEADISYRPPAIDGLRFYGGFLWNDTRYESLLNVPCYGGQTIAMGCNLLFSPTANGGAGGYTAQDRSGLPLIRAPRFSGNAGMEIERPIGGNFSLIFASNVQAQSRSLVNLGYIYYQEPFAKVDASFTLKNTKRWDVALVGKNLFDKVTTGNCSNGNRMAGYTGGQITGSTGGGVAGLDEVGCWADRGRELWLRATVHY